MYPVYDYWFKDVDIEGIDNSINNIFRKWIPINRRDKEESISNIEKYLPIVLKCLYASIVSPGKFTLKLKELLYQDSKKFLEYIIIIDQFYRTIETKYYRLSIFKNYISHLVSRMIFNEILTKSINITEVYTSYEAIFILMPLKHNYIRPSRRYNGLEGQIMNNLYEYKNQYYGCKLYDRFYYDTLEKYYTWFIDSDISYSLNLRETKNPIIDKKYSEICEYLDKDFMNESISKSITKLDLIILDYVNRYVKPDFKICVSLSGGIDSMVMLYSLCKLRNQGKIRNNICAFHLCYGNRNSSYTELQFIKVYCKYLFVGLYTYSIKYVKRGQCKRDFYETLTRNIRFKCYKNIIKENGVVFLGHIKDDLIENIITNFSTNKHINNLEKFKPIDVCDGVNISRPLINTYKTLIEEYSEMHKIPYFLNTTPEWSNRGKFRNRFLGEFKEQYGEQGISNVIKSAKQIKNMASIIENMIINPLYKNLKSNNSIQLNSELLEQRYVIYTVFEQYFHSMGESKPSKKSINIMLDSVPTHKKFMLKKNYIVQIDNYKLSIITK